MRDVFRGSDARDGAGAVRGRWRAAAVVAALAVAGFQAAPARAEEPEHRFLYSPLGPGAGKGVLGIGARMFIFVPSFDLSYVRGLTDELDFTFYLNTLGVITFGDVGVRYRLLGSAKEGFTLGLRVTATPLAFFIKIGDSSEGVAIGATGGIIASLGGRNAQISLGVDAPVFFGGGGFVGTEVSDGLDVTPTLRPHVSVEFAVGDFFSMYLQGSAYIVFEDAVFAGPLIGVGLMW